MTMVWHHTVQGVWAAPPDAHAEPHLPEGEVPDPPALVSDSEGGGVTGNVERKRGQFFVRLVLQRESGISHIGGGPVCTTIDFYVDSGTGEWLIPRCSLLAHLCTGDDLYIHCTLMWFTWQRMHSQPTFGTQEAI